MLRLQERSLVTADKMVPPVGESDAAAPSPVPVRTHRFRDYLSVAILFYINLINYMDRYTIAGVLDGVITHYSLSHSMGGLLQTVFVVTYMVAAPVFGYLGDRYSRRIIMALGVAFWSATTLLGSLPPQQFGWFAVLRALVGVGEASYSTVAPTVIGDLFAGPMRTRMLAVFYFAIPVGSGLGYIVGSSVASAMGAWYWALRVTPALGLVAVLLILFVLREPLRGASDGGSNLGPSLLRHDLYSLARNRSYIWSTLGFTCVTFATGAMSWWAPTYMVNAINLYLTTGTADERKVNTIFGGITTLAGIVGVTVGSTLSARLRRRSVKADALICAGGMVTSVPLLFLGSVFAYKVPDVTWVLFFFGITSICLNWSIVADILLYTVVPTRRATGAAFQILCSHLLGDASSPYIVGLLYDAILAGRKDDSSLLFSLQYALYVPICVLVLGSLFFFILSWYIEADRNTCAQETHGNMEAPCNDVLGEQSLPSADEQGFKDTVPLIADD
ncbi:protein spinster homolog 1 isoform X2 [Ixodes scapularis]|uniref:protein spinster homolog 1 isoform X2 n=1 Tax=Ixodes scapularis TaxID=6945 RepID=UPI001A9FD02E|nr:protein spinster homolog 1 isoform X2 [Ixodes scapularis]